MNAREMAWTGYGGWAAGAQRTPAPDMPVDDALLRGRLLFPPASTFPEMAQAAQRLADLMRVPLVYACQEMRCMAWPGWHRGNGA